MPDPRERLRTYGDVQRAAWVARQNLAGLLREAVAAGVSVTEAAQLAGITRQTAHAYLSKSKEV